MREEGRRLKEEAQRKAQEDAIKTFWDSLSDLERMRLEAEALAQATQIESDVIKRGGPFASATKKSLLDAYALKLMQQAA